MQDHLEREYLVAQIKLEQASQIVAAVLAAGRARELKPLGIAVVDAGGHLIAFAAENGGGTLRLQIAMGKANGALGLGVSSRRIGELALEKPAFVAAVSGASPYGVVPSAGGVIIVNDDGTVMGAVGVTGDTSDNDEACAIAGVEASGLAVRAEQ